jgi:HD-GYP domain-containing protein (c-di-GMP phosphodiesterase class II)
MTERTKFELLELVTTFSETMDLVSRALVGHHRRTAYLASTLARALGMSSQDQAVLGVAGLMHDCGALTLGEKLTALEFEADLGPSGNVEHAYMGYVVIRRFDILAEVANLIRYHHIRWDDAEHLEIDPDLLLKANLLHLADRVDTLFDKDGCILCQATDIRERIQEQSGGMFAPELVDCMLGILSVEARLLDLASPYLPAILRDRLDGWNPKLNYDELLSLSQMFSTLIDFRSRFTATHSAGVSATAESLARLHKFSPGECKMMRLAGFLHDLGKLAVPAEILEKPGKLTPEEFAIIRSHTYHTYRVLERIPGLETVNEWASFHHERLNGGGYPFHKDGDSLSLGARIVAAADVLTAITEDRPYRAGMSRDKAVQVLDSMVNGGSLDGDVVGLLKRSFDTVDAVREAAQREALVNFEGYAERTVEFQIPS